MALGSPHEADESTKMALDVACETARIAVEGHVVVVTAAIWEIPAYATEILDSVSSAAESVIEQAAPETPPSPPEAEPAEEETE